MAFTYSLTPFGLCHSSSPHSVRAFGFGAHSVRPDDVLIMNVSIYADILFERERVSTKTYILLYILNNKYIYKIK
jgi:hypothetical protein